MESCKPEKLFSIIPGFEQKSKTVARSIHNTVLENKGLRNVFDALHGVWLKHPLHPALTDLVIGAWVCGSILDGITLERKSKGMECAADILISMGNALALPTALSGMADFSAIPGKSAKTAATHALLNAGGLLMNVASSFCRSSKQRNTGICLSAAAASVLMVSSWLGGKLSYEQRVGVNKIPDGKLKEGWQTAMKDTDLQENVPARPEVSEVPVLLHRSGTQIHAIGAVCAHEGGPLNEGRIHDSKVTCPWHQSVFDLKDGHVVHGPSAYPEPAFETRITGENIEIREYNAEAQSTLQS